MKRLLIVILLLVLMAGALVACAAGLVGVFRIASVEEIPGTDVPADSLSEGVRPIPVTQVQILTGYGSPIPALVEVSGTWPDLCAQLAEVGRPVVSGNQIAISLLATPATPGCPPDQVGLPFRMRIPLNWMALAEGAYTVNVNGREVALYVPVVPPALDPDSGDPELVAPVVPDPLPAEATTPANGGAIVPIPVEAVVIEVGVGSPIPVEVQIAGTWPSACAQQPQVRQTASAFHFEITVSADPGPANCPPDYVGLPFVIRVPLNVVQLPAGQYTVSANGVSTTFDVPVSPQAETATPTVEVATPTGEPAAATPTTAATVAAATATVPPTNNTGACSNAATFVADVTVPDGTRFLPGSAFYKTWRVRNSGTCSWGQHYTLAFRGGARLGAVADHFSISGPVVPGATVDVGVALVAPGSAGRYTGSWELETPDGLRFGVGRNNAAMTVVIAVEGPPPPQGSIRGLVWQDGNGNNRRDDNEEVVHADVLLFGDPNCNFQVGRTATVTGGAYAFYNLLAGRYCVVVADTAGTRVQEALTLAAGQDAVDVNLQWPPANGDPGTIAGVVFRDTNNNATYENGEPPVAGREVWLLSGHCDRTTPDARATTGADGRYTFKPLPPGEYCVALRYPGGHEDAQSALLGPGQVLSEFNLRAHLDEGPAGSISGLLWHDYCALAPDGAWLGNCVQVDPVRGWTANGVRETGEEGIGGVTIRLLPGACASGNPAVLASSVTAADGSYSFPTLAAGTYCVSMNAAEPGNQALLLPGDWSYPRPGIWYQEILLGAGEQRTSVNFGWDYQLR